jgi:hypothetical protein
MSGKNSVVFVACCADSGLCSTGLVIHSGSHAAYLGLCAIQKIPKWGGLVPSWAVAPPKKSSHIVSVGKILTQMLVFGVSSGGLNPLVTWHILLFTSFEIIILYSSEVSRMVMMMFACCWRLCKI